LNDLGPQEWLDLTDDWLVAEELTTTAICFEHFTKK
jgi:hypothetical protein